MENNRFTDLAGTPPLRAFYHSEGLDKDFEALKANRSYKPTKRSEATQGAVFPSPVVGITGTNDLTDLEIGETLTKFGFNRTAEDINTTPEEELDTTVEDTPIIEPGSNDPSGAEKIEDASEYTLFANITLGTISAPTVPASPAAFHVGPVDPSADIPRVEFVYQWQISSNGSSWTDISSTDTVYTNADTEALSVINYTSQSPVGDYYRCKVTDTNGSDAVYTNAVQAVAE